MRITSLGASEHQLNMALMCYSKTKFRFVVRSSNIRPNNGVLQKQELLSKMYQKVAIV